MHIVTMVITMTGHLRSRVVHVIERTLNGKVFVTFSQQVFCGQALGVDKFTSFLTVESKVLSSRQEPGSMFSIPIIVTLVFIS